MKAWVMCRGTLILLFERHTEMVDAARFSPCRKHVATTMRMPCTVQLSLSMGVHGVDDMTDHSAMAQLPSARIVRSVHFPGPFTFKILGMVHTCVPSNCYRLILVHLH